MLYQKSFCRILRQFKMTWSSQVPSRCDKDTDRHFCSLLVSERTLPSCPLLCSFFMSLFSPALFLVLWISFSPHLRWLKAGFLAKMSALEKLLVAQHLEKVLCQVWVVRHSIPRCWDHWKSINWHKGALLWLAQLRFNEGSQKATVLPSASWKTVSGFLWGFPLVKVILGKPHSDLLFSYLQQNNT